MGTIPRQATGIFALARIILASRGLRRRLLFRLTVLVIGLNALGVANVNQIPEHPLWMLAYWLGVVALTIGVFLLALWDLLAVRREQRASPPKP